MSTLAKLLAAGPTGRRLLPAQPNITKTSKIHPNGRTAPSAVGSSACPAVDAAPAMNDGPAPAASTDNQTSPPPSGAALRRLIDGRLGTGGGKGVTNMLIG